MFLDLQVYDESRAWRRIKRLAHRGAILFLITVSMLAQVRCVDTNAGKSDSAAPAATAPSLAVASEADANLLVRITDAPFPFDSIARADVRVTGVLAQIHGAGFNGFYQLSNQAIDLNLLELRGGLSAALVKARVPNGTIHQMRLIVSAASVTLKDGRVFDLQVPSGSQTGIKLLLDPPLEIRTGEVGELMLDFDVSKSFVFQGNAKTCAGIKGVSFKPVIRVGNTSVHGTISGEVYSDSCTPDDASDDVALTNATVTASPASGDSAVSGSGAEGRFMIFGLPEGDYALKAEAEGFESETLGDVRVVRANNTDVGRITLRKNCEDSGGGTDTSTDGSGGTGTDTGTGTSSGDTTSTDTATSTDTGVTTSTDTATSTSVVTSTDTSTSTSVTTDSDTATATDTGTSIDTSTIIEWSVMGFDATSQATSMQIFWQSAVPTTGVIYMGLSPASLDYRVVEVTTAALSHVVFLENLTPETTYYLQVVARDESGVLHESAVIAKTTKAP